jgi:holo-[acyl-carrier protein] synthase
MIRCGIDLVEVERIRAALDEHGDHFLHRVFTPAEIEYCASLRDPVPHYAARFALKEAFYKSLPPGVLDALVWSEVGLHRHESGSPELELRGHTATRLRKWSFAISVSHTHDHAIAQVLAFENEH